MASNVFAIPLSNADVGSSQLLELFTNHFFPYLGYPVYTGIGDIKGEKKKLTGKETTWLIKENMGTSITFPVCCDVVVKCPLIAWCLFTRNSPVVWVRNSYIVLHHLCGIYLLAVSLYRSCIQKYFHVVIIYKSSMFLVINFYEHVFKTNICVFI